jgi:N,N-dimethylformamidase beta subunit-like protein
VIKIIAVSLQRTTLPYINLMRVQNGQIEGYASLTSVPVGGNIDLFVNTRDATYSLTVDRMGWYAGSGGRKVRGPQVLAGVQQVTPTPTADPTTGLIECHWTQPCRIASAS